MSPTAAFPPGFGPGTYGASFADVYDDWYPAISDAAATARFVAKRCQPPVVIELGLGTGRLVPELRGAGLEVIGIDASVAMLKSGTRPALVADIADLPLRPSTAVGAALCAFNTLFNLPTAPLQQRAIAEAARVVTGDGVVIIEAVTGYALAEAERQSVGVSRITVDQLVLAATVVDHDAQTVTGQHVDITQTGGVRLRPWHLRWSTPEQLDSMASSNGLRLLERFADWDETAFDHESDTHISVYRKAT
ncbi:MAG: class I SAM-dependent methyltransferase [Acidimicrobiales bacterium]|nr:class I SAM-dependent methyltransferase [Acidimicrobiales bacterium]